MSPMCLYPFLVTSTLHQHVVVISGFSEVNGGNGGVKNGRRSPGPHLRTLCFQFATTGQEFHFCVCVSENAWTISEMAVDRNKWGIKDFSSRFHTTLLYSLLNDEEWSDHVYFRKNIHLYLIKLFVKGKRYPKNSQYFVWLSRQNFYH